MGKVIMSGIVPQLEEPSSVKPNFADNDWAAIIKACQMNAVPKTWEVGDQKSMTINGTDYAIDIIGKNHDVYSEGSGKAPLTFQMHDCYGTTYAMSDTASNQSGWTSCAMRVTHLPEIMELMPPEVQAGIKEVSKLTSAGNGSSTIKTTVDKLFLLSEIEVFGTTTYSYSGEGSQYDYYKAGNSKIKFWLSSKSDWWERSPQAYTSDAFCQVNGSGRSSVNRPEQAYYVSFAFCF